MKGKLKEAKFVDEKDVPEVVRRTEWEAVFGEIPEGKARVIDADEVSPSTIRTALKALQEKGKFKNLHMTTRRVGNKHMSYVVNPSEEETE